MQSIQASFPGHRAGWTGGEWIQGANGEHLAELDKQPPSPPKKEQTPKYTSTIYIPPSILYHDT